MSDSPARRAEKKSHRKRLFRNYDCDEAGRRVFGGVAEAAGHFLANQRPEVYCGYPRGHFYVPMHYPMASHVKQDGRLDVVVERTSEGGRNRRPASPRKVKAKGQ